MISMKGLETINILELFNKERFADGLVCPHCQSTSVVKNGKYSGKQRYKCKTCGKTFSDFTNTPLSMSHFISKWPIFIKTMIEGIPLRKAEKIVGVSYVSLFYWRHKALNAAMKNGKEELKGLVQVDDISLPYSEKGLKCAGGRIPRHRGIRSKYYSSDNVSVVFAADSLENKISNVVLSDRLFRSDVDEFLGDKINKGSVLCTNNKPVYVSFCRYKHLKQYRVRNAYNGGVHSICKVNNYICRFLDWMVRFNGVSTKHLKNYLFWYKFLNIIKFEESLETVIIVINSMATGNLNQTNEFVCQW